MYTFDHDLFLWLNFDGGAVMDNAMELVSGWLMWAPLYAAIFYAVWRRWGLRTMLTFIVCLALAMGIADMLCGIFKHTGMLKDLWASFPARHRPMFDVAVRELAHVPSYAHGPYGTVSAHAATVSALALFSSLALRRRWFSWLMCGVTLLVCYSRIYLACHFPVDIALGIVVGLISALPLHFLWKKLDATLRKLR
ncbi:MAG: phosphatase PAP2 family protein [Alistipes sp.]|nr:phosphatase PAP2 family protein [Alistipes sp.]